MDYPGDRFGGRESAALASLGVARQHNLEDMFQFGARIYRAFQPHFLAEFLNEGRESVFTEAMRQAAREALTQAALQIRGEGLSRLSADSMQRLLGTLAALVEAGQKLDERITA